MPRYIAGLTKVPVAKQVQRSRRYRVRGETGFVDRFPLGFGTLPEKILYDALSRRNIPFYYLNDIELIVPEIQFDQFFQADFILPNQRVIIEVQGAHWHSMPKTIEADALKHALYMQTGWRPLAWWDFDILNNINLLFMNDPDLRNYPVVSLGDSELTPMRRTKTDTSKGIRTLNRKRGQRLSYKKKPVSVKTARQKLAGFKTRG